MRSTQMFGLTNLARTFLDEFQQKDTCPECNTVLNRTEKTTGYTGMFDESPLKGYTLTDGRTAKEVDQYKQ